MYSAGRCLYHNTIIILYEYDKADEYDNIMSISTTIASRPSAAVTRYDNNNNRIIARYIIMCAGPDRINGYKTITIGMVLCSVAFFDRWLFLYVFFSFYYFFFRNRPASYLPPTYIYIICTYQYCARHPLLTIIIYYIILYRTGNDVSIMKFSFTKAADPGGWRMGYLVEDAAAAEDRLIRRVNFRTQWGNLRSYYDFFPSVFAIRNAAHNTTCFYSRVRYTRSLNGYLFFLFFLLYYKPNKCENILR